MRKTSVKDLKNNNNKKIICDCLCTEWSTDLSGKRTYLRKNLNFNNSYLKRVCTHSFNVTGLEVFLHDAPKRWFINFPNSTP